MHNIAYVSAHVKRKIALFEEKIKGLWKNVHKDAI